MQVHKMPSLISIFGHGGIRSDPGLADGLNVYEGYVTGRAVAESLGVEYKPVSELLP